LVTGKKLGFDCEFAVQNTKLATVLEAAMEGAKVRFIFELLTL
jgi:hypothetical protein